MKHLIAVTFTVFTFLSGVTFANAGIGDTQTEVEFKYPTDLVGFKYPETIEFEYPIYIQSPYVYK